ncbi:MAG: hypothetical protein IV100_32505 [Myxococcales bacterium]|nr:hypothetical protein [Myxococcales bacterium]
MGARRGELIQASSHSARDEGEHAGDDGDGEDREHHRLRHDAPERRVDGLVGDADEEGDDLALVADEEAEAASTSLSLGTRVCDFR